VGITNQQILECVQSLIEEQQNTLRQILERDTVVHREFRDEIKEIKERAMAGDLERKLILDALQRHDENWKQVWKLAIVPILGAVIAGILAAVGLIGG